MFKGIVHPKMNICSSFIHHQVGNQLLMVAIDFYSMEKNTYQ